MTWLVDPETNEPLAAIAKTDNWPPEPLPIYADFDYRCRICDGAHARGDNPHIQEQVVSIEGEYEWDRSSRSSRATP